jgi:hypothetical protein
MLCGELLSTHAAAPPFQSPLALLPNERWATVTAPLGNAGPTLRTLLESLSAADPSARPTAAAALAQLTTLVAALPSTRDD